ncbi:hypothetical protein EYF80_005956 [Liparis tanakae]|uniref:Uncharacterized protein n=1 Tax=Liparis tanakae TaxID=230148 RepID=A0A4Z2J0H6_9TELE|nr:hypothetical protein EYF80_005956 [Liparis tanakae]
MPHVPQNVNVHKGMSPIPGLSRLTLLLRRLETKSSSTVRSKFFKFSPVLIRRIYTHGLKLRLYVGLLTMI